MQLILHAKSGGGGDGSTHLWGNFDEGRCTRTHCVPFSYISHTPGTSLDVLPYLLHNINLILALVRMVQQRCVPNCIVSYCYRRQAHTQSLARTHTPTANTMRQKRKFNRPFVNKSRKVNSVRVLSLILAFNTNLDQLGTQQRQQQQLRRCKRNRRKKRRIATLSSPIRLDQVHSRVKCLCLMCRNKHSN